LEIPAQKILLNKFIQQACSPQEMEEVCKLMEADGSAGALQEILAEAWEQVLPYPELEADISAEIFQHICQTTGINNTPAPLEVKKELLPAYNATRLFLAAGIVLLLVLMVVPRK
jgi:hypothetical protein